MTPKRLVLLVEGDGDLEAVPILVKKKLGELGAWGIVTPDPAVIKTGGLPKLIKNSSRCWLDLLGIARKRRDFGAALLVLDGDAKKMAFSGPGSIADFCAATAARHLAELARGEGAGATFSVGIVFARREFESWLLAGISSLCGKKFSDGRQGIREDAAVDHQLDLENHPRDAKGHLSELMHRSYKPSTDQGELTKLVELQAIRSREMRSFARFDRAVEQLVTAIRTSQHIVSPE